MNSFFSFSSKSICSIFSTPFFPIITGAPVIIGKNGVEKIEQIDLDEKEKKEFMHSIDAVKALWDAASKIDPDLSK